MTKYLQERFSVAVGGEDYSSGWERIFGCDGVYPDDHGERHRCQLKRAHTGHCVSGDFTWQSEFGDERDAHT